MEKISGGGNPPRGVQLFISLLFIIVKASLKNDFAILVDLLLEDSLPKSKNSWMILFGLRKK